MKTRNTGFLELIGFVTSLTLERKTDLSAVFHSEEEFSISAREEPT